MKQKMTIMIITTIIKVSIMSGQLMAFSYGTNNYYETYEEYKLEWESQNNLNVLKGVSREKLYICYEYNGNGNRISKIDKVQNVSYTYDSNSNIESEIRNGVLLIYLYDDMSNIIGLKVNNTTYYYLKDSDLNVIAIKNEEGDNVAKYVYDSYGHVKSILGRNESGEWIDKSDDNEFIGTINLIRLHSYYCDNETGWYYNGFQYYDATNNKYIMCSGASNVINVPIVAKANVRIGELSDSMIYDNNVTMSSLNDLQYYIVNWYGSLLNDPNFGKPISYSSSWYSGLQTVEILSRLIYAENTFSEYDQAGIAWVLINRKNANLSYMGGGTFRGVATYSGQFSTITGSSTSTAQARTPDTSKNTWYNAVYLACCLLSTSNSSDYLAVFTRPTGIFSQKYFVALSYFIDNGRTDADGSGLEYYNGSWNDIKDVTIIFTYSSSLTNPSSMNSITSNSNLDTYTKRSRYNIFFNFMN